MNINPTNSAIANNITTARPQAHKRIHMRVLRCSTIHTSASQPFFHSPPPPHFSPTHTSIQFHRNSKLSIMIPLLAILFCGPARLRPMRPASHARTSDHTYIYTRIYNIYFSIKNMARSPPPPPTSRPLPTANRLHPTQASTSTFGLLTITHSHTPTHRHRLEHFRPFLSDPRVSYDFFGFVSGRLRRILRDTYTPNIIHILE